MNRLVTIFAFVTIFTFSLSFSMPFSIPFSASVSAQEMVPKKKETYVSSVLLPEGVRILKIDYPCDVHPTASVEIRKLTKGTLENLDSVQPIFLREKWLKRTDLTNHRLCDVLDECYLDDEDDMLVRRLNFENPPMQLLVLGWVGAFGVRDTVVQVRTENRMAHADDITLVFPNASRTMVSQQPTKADPYSKRAFGFDLVGADFEYPCELMVWVIRGEQILLEEQVHWEGRIENPYQVEEMVIQRKARAKKEKEDFFDDEEEDEGDDDDEGETEDETEDEGDDDDEGETEDETEEEDQE